MNIKKKILEIEIPNEINIINKKNKEKTKNEQNIVSSKIRYKNIEKKDAKKVKYKNIDSYLKNSYYNEKLKVHIKNEDKKNTSKKDDNNYINVYNRIIKSYPLTAPYKSSAKKKLFKKNSKENNNDNNNNKKIENLSPKQTEKEKSQKKRKKIKTKHNKFPSINFTETRPLLINFENFKKMNKNFKGKEILKLNKNINLYKCQKNITNFKKSLDFNSNKNNKKLNLDLNFNNKKLLNPKTIVRKSLTTTNKSKINGLLNNFKSNKNKKNNNQNKKMKKKKSNKQNPLFSEPDETSIKKIQKIYNFVCILCIELKNDNDPYEIIREYVDYIQENKFNKLISIIKNKKYKETFKEYFILERWIFFSIFYLYLQNINYHKYKSNIIKLVDILIENLQIYLELFTKNFNDNKKKLFFCNLNQELNFKKYIEANKFENLLIINKNNILIKEFLDEILKESSLIIKKSFEELKIKISSLNLESSLDFLLDAFCDFFMEKGVVTVEYFNNEVNKNENLLKVPFINENTSGKNYHLVLDLDETLIHYSNENINGQILVRPYAQKFLNQISKYYEIIIFTAAQKEYADWILDRLDRKKVISYRIYREHTILENNINIKDLSKLGRDLKKTIIIDNIEKNFIRQPQNGILIKSWYDDENDKELINLYPFLKNIVTSNSEDVKIELNKLKLN